MFIEIVDALRCPNAHEESWLVVAATKLEARHIIEGVLGCPVCRSEYPVRDGIADFRGAVDDTASDSRTHSALLTLPPAEQLAAMMNLADSLGFAVLMGRWGERAGALLDLVDCPPLLLVNPPADVSMQPGLSGIRCGATLPLAVGAARAVAIESVEPARIASAVNVTRTGGRIVAPADAPVPSGARELARDATVWVAEREPAPSALVTLHVRRG